jgi:hypothetical protein
MLRMMAGRGANRLVSPFVIVREQPFIEADLERVTLRYAVEGADNGRETHIDRVPVKDAGE